MIICTKPKLIYKAGRFHCMAYINRNLCIYNDRLLHCVDCRDCIGCRIVQLEPDVRVSTICRNTCGLVLEQRFCLCTCHRVGNINLAITQDSNHIISVRCHDRITWIISTNRSLLDGEISIGAFSCHQEFRWICNNYFIVSVACKGWTDIVIRICRAAINLAVCLPCILVIQSKISCHKCIRICRICILLFIVISLCNIIWIRNRQCTFQTILSKQYRIHIICNLHVQGTLRYSSCVCHIEVSLFYIQQFIAVCIISR